MTMRVQEKLKANYGLSYGLAWFESGYIVRTKTLSRLAHRHDIKGALVSYVPPLPL